MKDNCIRKMKELQTHEGKEKRLRLSIEAGGGSGFQYNFSLDDKSHSDDSIFERQGVKLVVDKISLDFVKNATVDYVDDLIRSAFQISISGRVKVLPLRTSTYLPPKEMTSVTVLALGYFLGHRISYPAPDSPHYHLGCKL